MTLHQTSPAATADYRSIIPDVHSRSVLLDRDAVCKELQEAYIDARDADWDDAIPVSIDTYIRAEQFIHALPYGLASPSVDISPDGKIVFEWYRSPRQRVAATINERGDIVYAALFNQKQRHGTDIFLDRVPTELLRAVSALF